MDATRRRFGSLLEWLCAAVCAAGSALLLVSIGIHNVQRVPAIVPVIAEEAPDPAPISGIPPGVARVPLLLLAGNREVRLGDRLGDVIARLGPGAQLISESREDIGKGLRAIRSYTDIGVQFILVFDAAGDQDLRLSSIFIR
jgi:hypothetical protein